MIKDCLKICSKCRRKLPVDKFSGRKDRPCRIYSCCRECKNKAVRLYRKNPEIKRRCIENMLETQSKYRHQWLEILKERNLLSCKHCGYGRCFKAIDFHHLNPKEKKMSLSEVFKRKPNLIGIKELEKSIPLCRNCHTELHDNLWGIEEVMPIATE